MKRYKDTGYLISDDGIVFSESSHHTIQPYKVGKGYLMVDLYTNGKRSKKYIQRR